MRLAVNVFHNERLLTCVGSVAPANYSYSNCLQAVGVTSSEWNLDVVLKYISSSLTAAERR